MQTLPLSFFFSGVNATSSRSHCVFTIRMVEGPPPAGVQRVLGAQTAQARFCFFCLILGCVCVSGLDPYELSMSVLVHVSRQA